MNPIKLSIWGDSIAKGIIFDEADGRYRICKESCPALLKSNMGIMIENHSVMGQTSEKALERMRKASFDSCDIVVLEYGGNDCDLDWRAVSEQPDVLQQGKVPAERYEQNLAEMVRHIIASGARPVLVTPPPLIAERYFQWISRNLNKENILRYLGDIEHIFRWQAGYALRMSTLAKCLGTALLDIRTHMLSCKHLPDLYCVDGIHPNAEGHAYIYQYVAPIIGKLQLI